MLELLILTPNGKSWIIRIILVFRKLLFELSGFKITKKASIIITYNIFLFSNRCFLKSTYI